MSRNIFSVVLTKFFVLVAGLIIVIIQARGLGVAERGILASYMVIPLLLISLTEGGMRQAATYFLGQGAIKKDFIFGSLIFYSFIAGGLGYFICYTFLILTLEISHNLALILALVVPLNVLISSLKGILLGFEDITSFNKVLFYQQYIVLFLLAVLYFLDEVTIESVIYTTLTSYTLNFLSGFYYLSKKISDFTFSFDISITLKMIRKGFVFAISLFLIELNYKFDIYMLSQLSNSYNLGIYTVSSQLTNLVWQLPSAVGIVLFSRASNIKDSLKDSFFTTFVPRALRITLFICFLSIILLCILSDEIVVLFFGQEYLESSEVILSLSIGVVAMVIFKILYVVIAGSGNPLNGVFIILPALIINVFLNYLYIPEYGAVAAGWSSSISYLICAFISIKVYKVKYRIFVFDFVFINNSDLRLILERFNFLLRK